MLLLTVSSYLPYYRAVVQCVLGRNNTLIAGAVRACRVRSKTTSLKTCRSGGGSEADSDSNKRQGTKAPLPGGAGVGSDDDAYIES